MEQHYTPNIEEFHHGFKFEINQNAGTDLEPNWECLIFRSTVMSLSLEAAVKYEFVRVKYLDKADIESCGWLFRLKAPIAKLGLYRLEVKGKLIVIYKLTADEKNWGHHVFEGILKNKAELQKLMVQLGI